MFNWFKSLFAEKESELVMKVSPPVTRVAQCNISEPIISIVNSMKTHPSRWKFEVVAENDLAKVLNLKDIKTDVSVGLGYSEDRCGLIWESTEIRCIRLTGDEKVLLTTTAEKLYQFKDNRRIKIKESPAKVAEQKERKRIEELYK